MKINKAALIKLFVVILSVVALVVIYHQWFLNFGILSKGDWGFYFKDSLSTVRISYFSTWLGDSSLGRVLIDSGQAPTYALYGFFAKFFELPFEISERFIHMWPVVLVAPIGSYLLLSYLFKSKIGILIGVLFYSFNTYFLTLQTGHLTLAGSYALFPLIFYLFLRYYDKPSLRLAAAAALASAIGCAYEPRGIFICIIGMVTYFVFLLAYDYLLNRNAARVFKRFCRLLIPVGLFLLLNIYWIIGIIASGGGSSSTNATGGSLFGSEYFTLNYAFTLFHPYWTGSAPESFVIHTIPLYYWIVPILVLLSACVNRKNIRVLGFVILACMGVLLAKQADLPFSGIYEWLYNNAPGFSAYREASKFYALVAISYSVLLAALFNSIQYGKGLDIAIKYRRAIITSSAFAIGAIVLTNITPIVTNNFGTLFVNRSIPSAEAEVNQIIKDDSDDFFRTLWLPTTTRWGYFNNTKPSESLTGLNANRWQKFTTPPNNDIRQKINNRITATLTSSQYDSFLERSAIKYLIVPSRDIANENDFFVHFGDDREFYTELLEKIPTLEKVPTKNKDISIYKNKNFNGYAYSFSSLVTQKSPYLSDDAYNFIKDTISPSSEYQITPNSGPNELTSIFSEFTVDPVTNSLTETIKPNTNTALYTSNKPDYSYQIKNNDIIFRSTQSKDGRLLLNDAVIDEPRELGVISEKIESSKKYILTSGLDTDIIDTSDKSEKNIDSRYDTSLYSFTGKNLMTNGSFESGTWTNSVQDCNQYNDKGLISMAINYSLYTTGRQSLELRAARHVACTTSQKISLNANNPKLLSIDYKLLKGRQSAYEVRFYRPNGTYTSLKESLEATDANWRTSNKVLEVPSDAISLAIVLKAIPNDTSPYQSTAIFDNIRLFDATHIRTIDKSTPTYTKIPLKTNADNSIEFEASNFDYKNLVKNGSFESGLWQKQVSDCNAYDDKPDIAMSQSSNASDGGKSLLLEAGNHIACTSPDSVAVKGGTSYQFTFDHKGDVGKTAGYSLSFNDNARTLYSDSSIKQDDGDWQRYRKTITAPAGATSVRLTLYSYASNDSSRRIQNYYDNVAITKVPKIEDKYFVIKNESSQLDTPKEIQVQIKSPTKKIVSIKHAKENFYMAVAESFDPRWRIALKDTSFDSVLSNFPFISPAYIAESDHYNLAGINGWKINANTLCNQSQFCTKNSDGTYNFEMVMEYTPQKYMNLAIVISACTLITIVVVLLYRTRKINLHEKNSR